jgi:hypothetical protein
MMAQYVGRSRFAPARILLLLVSACVIQLANVDASTTTTTTTITTTDLYFVNHGNATAGDDVSSHVQFSVKSARVTTAAAVALPALSLSVHPDKHQLLAEFSGTGLDRDLALRWSPSSRECSNDPNNNLDVVWTSPSGDYAVYKFHSGFPKDTKIAVLYFCRRNGTDEDAHARWNSLGDHVSIKFPIQSK